MAGLASTGWPHGMPRRRQMPTTRMPAHSRRPDLRRLLQPARFNFLLPDTELLDFPRHRHRERIHETHILRGFEMRDPAAAELAYLLLRHFSAGLQFDPGQHCLA